MNDLSEVIQAIKDRLPIESVVGQRVQLQRKGGRLWGLCPFHAEKTPSFSVLPDRGIFKCFGCGQGGDAISFLRELDGMDFIEVLRLLADQAGVEIPEWKGESGQSRDQKDRRSQMREALHQARQLYQQVLAGPQGGPARAYLEGREVSAAMVEQFALGWAPAEPGWLVGRLQKAGFDAEVLIEAGLVSRSQKDGRLRDRFWDRLMFPVQELGNRTVGFGGRYLPGSRAEELKLGKYINSPEGPLFPKRRLLYGIEKLQAGLRQNPEQPIIVCEGYLDVIMLHQAGLLTTVAALGTALTEDHARRLRRYDRAVALLLDPDEAGRRAAARGARILVREGVEARVAELPDGSDPADMVSSDQTAELCRRVTCAWDILDWRLSAWVRKADFRVPSVQAKAAREMAEWVQTTPNPVLAEVWMRQACDRLGISEQNLKRLSRPEVQTPVAVTANHSNSQTTPLTEASAQEILRQNEQQIVSAILIDPSLAAAYGEVLRALTLHDESAKEVLNWCFARRKEGEDCGLELAMMAFAGHVALPWLDRLRLLQMDDPKLVLERALEALAHNHEVATRGRITPDQEVSDADLNRYQRNVSISPTQELS
jgi:DNA primase